LWEVLKKSFPKKTHFQRLENRVSEGMPDCYICMNGVPLWVELKMIKNDRAKVQKSQIAWHLAHSRCGGVSFFLLHAPLQGDVFLFDGALALQIHGSCISDLRPAALYIGDTCGLPAALRPAALDLWNRETQTCDLRPAPLYTQEKMRN